MVGSRTIRVLAVLFMGMIFGSLALILLETAPPSPSARNMAAMAVRSSNPDSAIFRTNVPVQPIKWRNIVIHVSGLERPEIARECHFVVDAGGDPHRSVQMTSLWDRQVEGNHVYVAGRDLNADSIGVCLVGDFSQQPPAREQFRSLVALVQSLQRNMNISADHVYSLSDLDGRSRSPGAAFPAQEFAAHLLRPGR